MGGACILLGCDADDRETSGAGGSAGATGTATAGVAGRSPEELRLRITIENTAEPGSLGGEDVLLAPGVWVAHRAGYRLFEPGATASEELERLAEDGIVTSLLGAVETAEGVVTAGVFGGDTTTSYDDAPIAPGQSADFLVVAPAGSRVSFAGMWIQSNDTFYGSVPNGIALATGNVSDRVHLWDAGTEVNQQPGAGPDQAPRQAGPNTGADENSTIERIAGGDRAGFIYPEGMIGVTMAEDS